MPYYYRAYLNIGGSEVLGGLREFTENQSIRMHDRCVQTVSASGDGLMQLEMIRRDGPVWLDKRTVGLIYGSMKRQIGLFLKTGR